MSATKASVFGHPIHTAKLIVIFVATFAPIIVWFFSSRARIANSQRFVTTYYRVSLVATIVVMAILPFMDYFLKAPLLSNRSYGSVLCNMLFLFTGHYIWKVIVK
ncbi:MAG: hypothetical protein ABIK92_01750 [Pseudomonadota bacterium]